jgi:threonine synthase
VLKYISTRGQAPRLSFADTTLAGLAADGGLYVPEACPKLGEGEIANMANQNYLEVAWRVMLPFVSEDLPSEDLIRLLKASYKSFDTKDIAPLKQLEDNLHVLELFHGPTLAFKDVALQFLGQIFGHFLKIRNESVTIVGATSGDTGSAAIEAFRGKPGVNIFIFHPHKRVSEVQRRQMTTVQDANVFNVAIEGSFDDCQDLVKAMFNDATFRAEVKLSAINSINWARILAQVVYYIYAGAKLHDKTDRHVTFCVPTGNFGNVYAGYVAQSMGLPVEKLLVATNRNDILHRFFVSGKMKAEGVVPTISPSMDIEISSNVARLLFDMFGRMPKAVEQTMAHFRKNGPFKIDDSVMEGVRKLFASGRVDDAQTTEIIKRTWRKHGYLVDPHTAVGLGVAQTYLEEHPKAQVISLATAHPAKFPDAVKRATGVEPQLPERLADLHKRPERYEVMANDLAKVQDFVRSGVKNAR